PTLARVGPTTPTRATPTPVFETDRPLNANNRTSSLLRWDSRRRGTLWQGYRVLASGHTRLVRSPGRLGPAPRLALAQQVRRRAPLDPLHVRTVRLQSTITSSSTTVRQGSPPFPPGSRGPVPPRCGRRPHPASCSGSRSLSGTTRSGIPRPSRFPCT